MTDGPRKNAETVVVGRIVGVFGVKGWVKVKSFTEPGSNILNYSPWVLVDRAGQKQEVVYDDATQRPQGLIVHLKGIDDRDVAATLSGMEIEVNADALPELEDDFYWHELVGLEVKTRVGDALVSLGTVAGLMETGANDVLVVRPGKGSATGAVEQAEQAPKIEARERLIPYVPDVYVLDVDLEAGTIEVDWDPEF